MTSKPKIMLHIIMPTQISGPNTSNRRIASSYLSDKYEFGFLTQTFLAGGKINFKLIKELKKQVEQFNPDIIHISGLQSSGFHAVLATRLAGYKNIILTVRGFSGDAINLSKINNFFFTKIFEPLTLMLADKIYTVCEEASHKKMIQQNKNKFIGVIHNAAPIIDPDILNNREKARIELEANEKDILIAVSGRMIYDKGISFISQAIKNMNLDNKKIIFIGDGKYCDILKNEHSEKIIQKKIYILGQRNDVLNILSGCDIFLFATLHENLSNSLLEACSMGLPVVATNVGGNIEVIKDGINGFLIPPMNHHAIKEKLEILSDDMELRKTFANNSITIMREEFSQQKLYSMIDKIYCDYLEVRKKK